MIHVEYEKEYNFPHDREIILFDRCAFQNTHRDVLAKINKKYNILCPRVFIMECISPNNSDNKPKDEFERDKISLLEKLELIENPIVIRGNTNVTNGVTNPIIIPPYAEYTDILDSWRIARNCIIDSPLLMKRVSPQVLVSNYTTKVDGWKHERREINKICDKAKGTLRPSVYREQLKKRLEILDNKTLSMSEVKRRLRSDPSTNLTQKLPNAANHALMDIQMESKEKIAEGFRVDFGLNLRDTKKLYKQINDAKNFTIENYPRLSYPIFIFYLTRFMLCAIQQNSEHLDASYFPDFQYLRYLNFCDRFIVGETSTPHIVKALPYSDIKNICIMTSKELRQSLI